MFKFHFMYSFKIHFKYLLFRLLSFQIKALIMMIANNIRQSQRLNSSFMGACEDAEVDFCYTNALASTT